MTGTSQSDVSAIKTVLITGATDGLGRGLALRLADDGHDVVLHGRREDALAELAQQVADSTGGLPRTVLADLSSLDQVQAMSRRLAAELARLDVLVNNAGIGSGEPDGTTRRVSKDDIELRLAVNYLAPALLALELLPLLKRSAPARIVNVASIGQQPIDRSDLQLSHDYEGHRAYAQSKLALIAFGFELAKRLDPAIVTVNSLHPATYMPTKIVMQSVGNAVDTIEDGITATARLIEDPALDGVTGRFFDQLEDASAHPQAYEPAFQEWLWNTTMRLLGRSDTQK